MHCCRWYLRESGEVDQGVILLLMIYQWPQDSVLLLVSSVLDKYCRGYMYII